jgi:pimeloyl-ACP methyl ester carboxylesterase
MLRKLSWSILTLLLFASVFVGGLGALLATVAHTTPGRLAGLGSLSLAVVPWMLLSRRARGWLAVPLVGGVLAWAAASWHAPAPSEDGAGLTHHLPEGQRFRRHAVANIVPEVDQFELGSWLLPTLDPFIDAEQAARVRGLFREVYAELPGQPGSAMPWAYAELFPLASWDVGHRYEVVPTSEEALPVVLFLHGWGGNFQAYSVVLGELGRERGFAVVAPSFGMGRWARPEGAEVVRRTLADIEADPRLDASRVVLVGLSNGGPGVTRALETQPRAFAGVLYLSAVVEPERMQRLRLPSALPVSLLAGDQDRRIPIELQRRAAEALPQARLTEVPGQDHFLMFSDREAVGQALVGLGL